MGGETLTKTIASFFQKQQLFLQMANLEPGGGELAALHDVCGHPEGAVQHEGEEQVGVDLVSQAAHLPEEG